MITERLDWDRIPEHDKRETTPPRNRSRTGYGRKIPTGRMVRINGKWRRVYCYVYSNAGTCYVPVGADWIVIY